MGNRFFLSGYCTAVSLARALDTNVDTLLQFEEELSQERLDEYLNEILEKARTGNREEAEAMLQKQLHTYPSSSALKYNATTVLNFFLMIFPMESPEKKKSLADAEETAV